MKSLIILIAGIFSMTKVMAQSHQSHALASDEVQLVNLSGIHLDIRSSFNKRDWEHKSLNNRDNVDVTIPRQYAYWYIEICQATDIGAIPDCDTYKLEPEKRYAIRFTDSNDKLIIRIMK